MAAARRVLLGWGVGKRGEMSFGRCLLWCPGPIGAGLRPGASSMLSHGTHACQVAAATLGRGPSPLPTGPCGTALHTVLHMVSGVQQRVL